MKISVVVPLYNKADCVERAVRSVLAQTFDDWEMVVVDDGSTDRGAEVVKNFDDPRIRVLVQANAGVSAARNRGINESRAELIAFLDADDEWMPTHLRTIAELRQSFPSCSTLATGYILRHPAGGERPATIRGLPAAPWRGIVDRYFDVACQSEPPVWSSAVAASKNALSAIGGFPVGIGQGEDLLTWARLAVHGPIAYCAAPSAVFWQTPTENGLPTRRPEQPDRVGTALRQLCDDAPADVWPSIRRYLGRWHKMRGTMFLRLCENSEARRELLRAAAYAPRDKRTAIYLVLSLLPGHFGSTIARKAALRSSGGNAAHAAPNQASLAI